MPADASRALYPVAKESTKLLRALGYGGVRPAVY